MTLIWELSGSLKYQCKYGRKSVFPEMILLSLSLGLMEWITETVNNVLKESIRFFLINFSFDFLIYSFSVK